MKIHIKATLILLLAVFSVIFSRRIRKTSDTDKYFVAECKSWCTFGAKELWFRERKETYFCVCKVSDAIGFTRGFDHQQSGWGTVPSKNHENFHTESKKEMRSVPLN